jgi:sporulation protein YlmC with PRC-barrel domain
VPLIESTEQLLGMTVVDRDGDRIGKIEDVHVDRATGRPGWLGIGGGLFSGKASFVPAGEATREGDDVRVPYEKAHVKDAPTVDADGPLSPAEEERLRLHYGLDDARRPRLVVTEGATTVPFTGGELRNERVPVTGAERDGTPVRDL